MPRRALALLCLAACAAPSAGPPTPAVERTAEAPVPGDSPAVPKDSRPTDARSVDLPVPPDSPPRLLAAVTQFGVLADGGLLIESTDPAIEGLERLDPTSGARTPWSAPWTPEGWHLRRGSEPGPVSFEVSPDGRWVALAHSLEIRRNPALDRPELVALIVARSDGSDPRCVGVGVPSDDPPPYTFSRDGRLVGDWTVACMPGPRGVPVAFEPGAELDAWPRRERWYDPDDGSAGVVPDLEPWWYDKDPLGDHVAMQDQEGRRELEFRNFVTSARIGAVPLGDGPGLRVRDWVGADMLLAEVMHADPAHNELRLVMTDGRSFPAPHAQWRVYTRLPDGTHLLSRDDGATIEHARVDWPRFTIEASRRRPDLEPFVRLLEDGGRAEPSWTPGLGGVLIHDYGTGDLYLAEI